MEWSISENLASIDNTSFTGSFDLAQPWSGVKLRRGEHVIAEHLFACLVPDAAVETWGRGPDLFCRYPPRNSDLVSYQTYYREVDDGIEFILSAQTSLLDSKPLTQVTNRFSAGELWYRPSLNAACQQVTGTQDFDLSDPPGFFLVRPAAFDDLSWAIFVHPSDFHRVTVRATPEPSIAYWLFPEPLEKGVIRRAQMAFHVVSRTTDEQDALRLLATANTAAPPLTT